MQLSLIVSALETPFGQTWFYALVMYTQAWGLEETIINLSRTNNMLPGSPAKSPTGPRDKCGMGVEIALRLGTLERGIKLLMAVSIRYHLEDIDGPLYKPSYDF